MGKTEFPTFDGTPASYSKVIKNFKTKIESRISDCKLKFSYLMQYCDGEAN